jgi:glycosyltransferase involved in cell wall biosynthesis
LPVVSTAVSGTQDILLGKKGGYVAKVNNEDSLFFAMQNCHNNYNIAKKKTLYAKKFLHRFLIKIQNKKYLELVENI